MFSRVLPPLIPALCGNVFFFNKTANKKALPYGKALSSPHAILFALIYCILPASLGYARNGTLVALLSETNTAHIELSDITVRTTANLASVILANRELRLLAPFLNHCLLGHSQYLPFYALKGIPMSFKSSRASSSVFAVVTITMFMPRSLSILSYSISGKMSCSFRPTA